MYVLLDALDEMDPKSRRKLLSVLQSTCERLKLLVTGRSILETGAQLFGHEEIEMRATTSDLAAFFSAQLSKRTTQGFPATYV